MKQIRIVCALIIGLLASAAACHAADMETRNIQLCRQVIARTLCKPPAEVEFIDRYMDVNTLTFTVFYAKKPERFICNISGNEVRIKGNAWAPLLRTVTVTPVPGSNCVDLGYFVPECPRGPVRVCAPDTAADEQQRKELEFWDRPIPELLQDELTSGIAREVNATEEQPPATNGN